MENSTNIVATFKSENIALLRGSIKSHTGIRYHSSATHSGNTSTVTWIVEEANPEKAMELAMEDIDLNYLDSHRIELNSLFVASK